MKRPGTYVYCVLDHRVKPRVPARLTGIPYGGRVRLLPVGAHRSLVASDVPLARYGDAALEQGIADLEWVSRVALAHERVIEAFLAVDAVLPMKLFTIFATDERAVAHVAAAATELDLLARRVTRRQEWGIRVVLAKQPTGRMSPPPAASARSGAAYLQHKKAVKDEAAKRAGQARAVAAELFESLAAHATEARKRSNREIAAAGGSLLLDAALLVPRSGSSRFRAAAARHARALSSEGYTVALTGPWPPYSFMRD
jgi:hypothetical protein